MRVRSDSSVISTFIHGVQHAKRRSFMRVTCFSLFYVCCVTCVGEGESKDVSSASVVDYDGLRVTGMMLKLLMIVCTSQMY